MSNSPRSFPVWLIVVLAVGGGVFLSCCVLPCIIGSLMPNVDKEPAQPKPAAERKKTKEEEKAEFLAELDRKVEKAKEWDRQHPEDAAEEKAHFDRVEAWMETMTILKGRQRPSTVSFGAPLGAKDLPDHQDPDTCVNKQEDGTFLVKGWVDVKNASGETNRYDFSLSLRATGDGKTKKWALAGDPVLTLSKHRSPSPLKGPEEIPADDLGDKGGR